MLKNRQLYVTAAASFLIVAAGVAVAKRPDLNENDARAVLKAQVSLIQAVIAAEQVANGKAMRVEFEQDKKGQHYDVEVVSGAKVYDVRIDAVSGKVLSLVEDRDDQDDDG